MDGQEYLNQISQSSRRKDAPSKNRKFLSPKKIIIGAVGVILLIVILVVSLNVGKGDGGEKTDSYKLKLHLDNTAAVIQDYQSNIRSSNLRSSSASLRGILTITSRDFSEYLSEKYNLKKDKDISKEITQKADKKKEELSNELFEAKISGRLDRTFAYNMAYEISTIRAEEMKILNETKSDKVKEILNSSIESLDVLYEKFDNFSETNN